jgi:hypothetical protein
MCEAEYGTPKSKLHWYQFSLRSLLILMTIHGVLCSCLSVGIREWGRVRHARELHERLVKLLRVKGGGVLVQRTFATGETEAQTPSKAMGSSSARGDD